MLRKSICFLILAAMTLHCASRLGTLSFVYKNRHSMALYIGLIGEVPIAMCNSDYNFLKELKVEAIDTNQAIPWLTQAHEINLFFIEEYRQANPQKIFLLETAQSGRIENYYLTPIFSVFHPPSILA